MTNFEGNFYFGVVLCFWIVLDDFCNMDGHFTSFMIMKDSIALPRCMDV